MDPINQLSDLIKSSLRKGIKNESLKDGNIPVKSIIDSIDYEMQSRNQLPVIQYDFENAGSARYWGNCLDMPFQVKLICWVDKGSKPKESVDRAYELRSNLLQWINEDNVFGYAVCPKETLEVQLESKDYSMPFATGAGLIIRGRLIAEE